MLAKEEISALDICPLKQAGTTQFGLGQPGTEPSSREVHVHGSQGDSCQQVTLSIIVSCQFFKRNQKFRFLGEYV